MTEFTLILQDSQQSLQFDDVEVFSGEDASGSFSILAGHERMMTALVMGLARFRRRRGEWQYLALPEAILYFHGNTLQLSTRHYLIDSDFGRISELLERQILAEEEQLRRVKTSLLQMEDEVMRRLWNLDQRDSPIGRGEEWWP